MGKNTVEIYAMVEAAGCVEKVMSSVGVSTHQLAKRLDRPIIDIEQLLNGDLDLTLGEYGKILHALGAVPTMGFKVGSPKGVIE